MMRGNIQQDFVMVHDAMQGSSNEVIGHDGNILDLNSLSCGQRPQ